MSNLRQIIKKWSKLAQTNEAVQERLDDLVHQHFSMRASGVNNEGPEYQILFLLDEGGYREIDLEDDLKDFA